MEPFTATCHLHVDPTDYLEENRDVVEAAAERVGLADELARVFER